jgi:hypothetical protein
MISKMSLLRRCCNKLHFFHNHRSWIAGSQIPVLILTLFFAGNVTAQMDIGTGLLCPGEYGVLNCVSNDVSIATITPDPAVESCIEGQDFVVGIEATVEINSNSARRDVGIWISETDGDPSFNTPGDDSSCLVATFPNAGILGFGAAPDDIPPDLCGDALAQSKGTSVVVDLGDITLPCIPDANGDLVIQPVVTWVIDKAAQCNGPDSARPGSQKSKCESGPVALDITVITPPAFLTLEKTVVDNFGGGAADTDWTLAADGDVTDISGIEGAGAVTNAEVEPGDYILSEIGGPGGYTETDLSCDGGTLNGHMLTLASDDDVTCTFTNNDLPAGLSVTKIINSDDGGTANLDAFDVSVAVNGLNATEVTWPNANATTTGTASAVTQVIGTHTLSEIAVAGYANGDWSCEDDNQQAVTVTPSTNNSADAEVTLAAEQLVVCTITNSDIPPTLTLVKTVVNGFGGTATQNDFQARIDGGAVDWDVAIPLTAGVSYSVSETGNLSDYSAGAWGGDCAADGSITLSLDEDATCTITNTQDEPIVIVAPVSVPTINAWSLVTLALLTLGIGWHFRSKLPMKR